MQTLVVDKTLTFDFDPHVEAEIFDGWDHVTKHWTQRRNKKLIDVVSVESVSGGDTAWLIEVKDFRVINGPPKPSNIATLDQTVAKKVQDSLLGLADTAANGAKSSEKAHAANTMAATSRRVVLHLEPHVGAHTALFPTGFPASVLQKLKTLVAHIDPNPLVLDISRTARAGVPWIVR